MVWTEEMRWGGDEGHEELALLEMCPAPAYEIDYSSSPPLLPAPDSRSNRKNCS